MPIIGLTDRAASFPRLGILRKGAPKPDGNRPGQDLKTHFRLESDHADVREAFERLYGDKPNHIKVILTFPHASENFEAWKEHHSAGALKRRCDGETCVQRLRSDGSGYDFAPTTCVCASELAGADKKHLCRPVGRLKIVIPELGRLGYLLVPTTSIHDIIELQSNLEAAEALRGSLTGILFILSRRPRKVSVPDEKTNTRRKMEKWLLSLEPAPDWVRLQVAAMQQAALPAPALALPAPANGNGGASYVDPETGEIFDADEDAADLETIGQVSEARRNHTPQPPVAEEPPPARTNGMEERDLPPVTDAERTAPVELATVSGAASRFHSWFTDDGAPRIRFNLDKTIVIAAGPLAETWFDLEDGEQVIAEGAWKVHPKVGSYLAAAGIVRADTQPQVAEDLS